jgi:hypothetical protein
MTDKLPSAKFPPYAGKYDWSKEKVAQMMANDDGRDLGLDKVNHPPHYTKGKYEAIDVIEDAVQFAPDSVIGGLQWQALKYILRMWHKDKALEDAKKAQWYLTRLIETLEK